MNEYYYYYYESNVNSASVKLFEFHIELIIKTQLVVFIIINYRYSELLEN